MYIVKDTPLRNLEKLETEDLLSYNLTKEQYEKLFKEYREPQEKSVSYTSNGDYEIEPDKGKAFTKVNVNVAVPDPVLETLELSGTAPYTKTVTPSEGYDAIEKVNINVTLPQASIHDLLFYINVTTSAGSMSHSSTYFTQIDPTSESDTYSINILSGCGVIIYFPTRAPTLYYNTSSDATTIKIKRSTVFWYRIIDGNIEAGATTLTASAEYYYKGTKYSYKNVTGYAYPTPSGVTLTLGPDEFLAGILWVPMFNSN